MGQLGGAPAVGEIAVVADAMEAVRQGVEQKAADAIVVVFEASLAATSPEA